jgi:membrane-associated phospholipid phosphatase
MIGGELYNEALRRLFHRIGPDHLLNSFPSDQTLMTITLFGFAGYLFARHIRRTWARTTSSLFVLSVSFLVGLSQIYFQHHFPSDVVAGYVFGGVWLSLNIISLEIFRLTKNNRHHFFT